MNILTEMFGFETNNFFIKHLEFGYIIPIIEITIPFLLLLKRTRKIGVILAFFSHLFIIYFVSPLGINNDFIVIPWNFFMILTVILVFYRTNSLTFFYSKSILEQSIKVCLILFVLIFPSLNLIEKWDNFLSFNLYSDKTKNILIIINEEEIKSLDSKYLMYFDQPKGIEGGRVLNLNRWSFKELNVLYYPEEWVMKNISSLFCDMNISEENLIFIEFRGLLTDKNLKQYTCKELSK